MENNWLNQIKDMEKSRQKIYRALPFFSTQLPHNFPKKKLQTGTSESISGTCWRLTNTTTTFAYTSPFLLREAASISTVAISFDFALLQLISFLLDFARGAKDQFSFGRDLPYFTRYFMVILVVARITVAPFHTTIEHIPNFYLKKKWER